MHGALKSGLAIIGAGLVTLAVTFSVRHGPLKAEASGPSWCAYREAGPAGPRGNLMKIRIAARAGIEAVFLEQWGERLRVFATDFGPGEDDPKAFEFSREDAWAIPCSGTTPTVRNLDRIDLRSSRSIPWIKIDASRAGRHLMFAPGATPERSGSEIEIRLMTPADTLRPRGSLAVTGTDRDDHITVGSRKGRVVVNFNHGREGRFPDADITPGPAPAAVGIYTRGGNDIVNGLGAGAGTSGLDPSTWLDMDGGAGRDRLTGHDGRNTIMGGPGSDVVRGGLGGDLMVWSSYGLSGGPGRDRVYGGPGNDDFGGINISGSDRDGDRVYGGTGFDSFWGYRNGDADVIDCGPGGEGETQFDPRLDSLKRCRR